MSELITFKENHKMVINDGVMIKMVSPLVKAYLDKKFHITTVKNVYDPVTDYVNLVKNGVNKLSSLCMSLLRNYVIKNIDKSFNKDEVNNVKTILETDQNSKPSSEDINLAKQLVRHACSIYAYNVVSLGINNHHHLNKSRLFNGMVKSMKINLLLKTCKTIDNNFEINIFHHSLHPFSMHGKITNYVKPSKILLNKSNSYLTFRLGGLIAGWNFLSRSIVAVNHMISIGYWDKNYGKNILDQISAQIDLIRKDPSSFYSYVIDMKLVKQKFAPLFKLLAFYGGAMKTYWEKTEDPMGDCKIIDKAMKENSFDRLRGMTESKLLTTINKQAKVSTFIIAKINLVKANDLKH
jgi:hypothetical protein